MSWRRGYSTNRKGFSAVQQQSSNWRHLTEEDRQGPRASEVMLSTTEAKKRFDLMTSDLERIKGYRRPHAHYGGGNNLTLYYHSDLVAAAIGKLGQDRFDQTKEGGKKKPYCGTRQAAINRILAAGYSEAAEAAHHVKQRAADEAAAAQRAKEFAAQKVEQDRKDAISREKAAKAKVEMDRRMCLFEQDLLDPEDLDFKELQYQLRRLKCPGNGKKAELCERLEGAVALQKQWIVETNEATGTIVWIGPTGMKFHEKEDAVDAGWCAPSKLAAMVTEPAAVVTEPAAVVAKPAAVVSKPPEVAHATPQMLEKPAQPEALFVEPISIDLTDDQPPTMHKAARVVPPAVSAQVQSGAKRVAPVQAQNSVAKKRGGIMSFFKKVESNNMI